MWHRFILSMKKYSSLVQDHFFDLSGKGGVYLASGIYTRITYNFDLHILQQQLDYEHRLSLSNKPAINHLS